MFGKRLKLFKLFGFEVGVDLSWVIIAILIAWSLSTGYFPFQYENLSTRTYWIMGIVGALGLFISIIAHEFSHSLAAKKFGLPMKGITLFIFGGVAEMTDEPPSPKAEFTMAIMGPVASVALALFFYTAYQMGAAAGWRDPVVGVVGYLGFINLVLAIFNLIPAFPLDGGRVLRSVLWGWKDDLRWATRVSSRIGAGFGVFLIVLGFLRVINGNFVGGMWFFLIGMFLHGAARASYQQLITRRALQGETVRRFMKTDPVTVPPSITLDRVVEDYIYKYHHKLFPVTDSGRLIGCITTREVKEIPQEQWPHRTAGQVAQDCSETNTISPDADALNALSRMSRNGSSRLMVVEGDQVVGIIALKDMLSFLSLKVELNE